MLKRLLHHFNGNRSCRVDPFPAGIESHIGRRTRLTFASLCAVHVGEQDVVVVRPVDPLVCIIDGEGAGVIDLFVNDNHLTPSIHSNAPDVRGLTAVHPEHVASQEYENIRKQLNLIFDLLLCHNKYVTWHDGGS